MRRIKPPRDALGKLVPRWLLTVFDTRRKVTRWCVRLDRLRAQIGEMAHQPGGEEIPEVALRKALLMVRSEILLAAPWTQCDCPSKQQDCPKCQGRRWVSGRSWLRSNSPKRKSGDD